MSNTPDNVGIFVSSGRTGTRFLAEYFDKNYDDITAVHEPKPSYAIRRYSNAYMHGTISDECMIQLLKRKRKALMAAVTTPTYIESNPYLHGFVPFLHTQWPNAKIIHLVRDPRTAIMSGLNHQDARWIKKFANRWVPHWVPDVRTLLNLPKDASPIAYYAGFWQLTNNAIHTAGQQHENYTRLNYEDLFENDCQGLRQICDILSIDFKASKKAISPKTRINKSISSRTTGWPTWTAAECAEVHEICSPLMQEYGYGLDQPWLDRVKEGADSHEKD